MKKLIAILICIVMTFSLAFSFACAGPQGQQGNTPQLRISQTTNEWEVSYDNGESWTSLGVKATGNDGSQGLQGPQGITPKLQINETTNEWEVSYDNGVTWTSLGVKASCDCDGSGSGNSKPNPINFEPITRFAVVSDVHVRADGAFSSLDRLNSVLDSVWDYAESQEDYTELDALFFLGDNTQNGQEAELNLFFDTVEAKTQGDTVVRAIMGNHEYKNPTGTKYTIANMEKGIDWYLQHSGYESEDAHYTLDGYHHILISMDRYGSNSGTPNVYLSETKMAWLKEQLDLALEDDPTGEKPIFIYQHIAPQSTMFNAGSDLPLRELLNDYPNVVDFSGHSHRDMSDPRAIWQDEFTAVAVGSMAYECLSIAGHPTYNNSNSITEVVDNGKWIEGAQDQSIRNGVMYYICEIDENNLMRMLRYNVATNSIYGDPIYIDSFGDPTGFDYTEERKENSVAPTFEPGDTVMLTANHYNKTKIKFPQATCEDNIVQNYRVDILNESNVLVKSEYRLARSYMGDAKPENMEITIAGLTPNSKYTLKVYAVNAYGKQSAPISTEVTTSAKTATPTADILSLAFNADGSATDTANGAEILKVGKPTAEYSETLSKNMSVMNNNGAYVFKDVPEWYTTMQNSFAIEMYIYITDTSTGLMGLASSKQGGGFEIGYTTAGMLNFHVNVNSYTGRKDIYYAVNIQEWLHIVGVFDAQTIKLYVNGELVGSAEAAGELQYGQYTSQYIAIGGGATSRYQIDTKSKCKMATFNIYSDALTAEEISTLYSAYKA
ncbi:MAG: metallophosphoesterase [Clostridia bacterium]|nr:metallophosphoesterase [Clostridia bacterium]